jgi:hypothetical protein
MTSRIDENLKFRKDKMALASLEGEGRAQANANARFFTSVEGLFALNKEEAIEGLYVATEPHLRLARADKKERTVAMPIQSAADLRLNKV